MKYLLEQAKSRLSNSQRPDGESIGKDVDFSNFIGEDRKMDVKMTVNVGGNEDPRYKVEKIKNTQTKEVLINDDPMFPTHPFFMICVGPRKKGKTNTILDFVYNKIPPGFFDLIIVYSKTIDDDDKWLLMKDMVDRDYIFKNINPERLRSQFITISEVIKIKPDFKTLMIFDDMISDNKASRYHIDEVGELAVMGRHKGISVIFSTQVWKALGTPLRVNATNVLIFEQGNNGELEKLAEELRGVLSKQDFMELYKWVFTDTSNKPFMHVNRDRALGLMFTKGWGQQIKVHDVLERKPNNVGRNTNKPKIEDGGDGKNPDPEK